ncbi:MAG: S41 family peptidase [Planctomycetota bacterium]
MRHALMSGPAVPRLTALVLISWLYPALFLAGCTTATNTEVTLSAQQQQLNLDSFDYVWTTIRDKHWDPELGGLDWPAVRDELRPQVAEASSMSAARQAMNDMIARLEQSHFGIIPAEVYTGIEGLDDEAAESVDNTEPNQESAAQTTLDEVDQSEPARPRRNARDGVIGIDVRVIDGQALVTRVRPGLPADELQISTGWQIVSINGREMAPLLEGIDAEYRDSTLRDLILAQVVAGRVRGPIGSTVNVEFLDGDDQPVALEITRVRHPGQRAQLGHLPALYVTFESRLLADNIGYIALSTFFDPVHVMEQFGQAIRSFRDTNGIVLDLRGNPGGIGGMSMGMSGWFVSEPGQQLGYMRTRDTRLNFIVFSRAWTYDGPLAILVDGASASTAEILAGGLQGLERARIFGTTSAGAALPSVIEKLPNGDGFQYAIADYVSAGGQRLEGRGVIPDTVVRPTRASLLANRDVVLEAAVEWIHAQP